mmetsp:Transcript_1939/g.6397  ORF Transcript_1939/g.6397 Transcript_1939/m.6397 type:complete len:346 (-) Transcript_1939:146-1183(-)
MGSPLSCQRLRSIEVAAHGSASASAEGGVTLEAAAHGSAARAPAGGGGTPRSIMPTPDRITREDAELAQVLEHSRFEAEARDVQLLEHSRFEAEAHEAQLAADERAALEMGVHLSQEGRKDVTVQFWQLLGRPTVCTPLLDFLDHHCHAFAEAGRPPTSEQLALFVDYGEAFDTLLAVEESTRDTVGEFVPSLAAIIAQGCAFAMADGLAELNAQEVSKIRLVLAVVNFNVFRIMMEETNREIAGAVVAHHMRSSMLTGVVESPATREQPDELGENHGRNVVDNGHIIFGLPVYDSMFEQLTMGTSCTSEEEELTVRKQRGMGLLATAMREVQACMVGVPMGSRL